MSEVSPNERIYLKNERLSVIVSPSEGGAIISATVDGAEMLAASHEAPGRIEEVLGTPQDSLGSLPWEATKVGESLVLETAKNSIFIEKRLALHPRNPQVQVDYRIINLKPIFVRPAFGLRFAFPLAEPLRALLPSPEGVRSESPASRAERRYLRPGLPACGIAFGATGAIAVFPSEALDGVEIFTHPGEGIFSVTPLAFYVGLSPYCEAGFSVLLHFGVRLHEQVAALLEENSAHLTSFSSRPSPERLNRALELAQQFAALPEDPQSREQRRNLLERHQRLADTRPERLQILQQLGEGQVSMDEALQELTRFSSLTPNLQ